MQLIVNDLAISYQLSGNGKTLLFLHGWGDNQATFKALIAGLGKNFQVLTLDLPGFGASQAPPKAWNLDAYARCLDGFLAKLEVKPYAIIGHSNGGALAIRALAINELNAEKLVLIASAGIRNSQPLKRRATKLVAKAGKATTFWLPVRTRQGLRKKLYGTVGSDMLVVPELSETFKLTVAQDVQADASKLTLPTLIINADSDPAIPIKDGQLLHQLIKGSRFVILHSKSHFIHQEQAESVAKEILKFL